MPGAAHAARCRRTGARAEEGPAGCRRDGAGTGEEIAAREQAQAEAAAQAAALALSKKAVEDEGALCRTTTIVLNCATNLAAEDAVEALAYKCFTKYLAEHEASNAAKFGASMGLQVGDSARR